MYGIYEDSASKKLKAGYQVLFGLGTYNVDHSGPGMGYGGVLDLPRWVQSVVREEWTAEVFDLELMRYKDIEEELVGLLQIAMACTQASPDQRPNMNHIVKMIEELRGVEVSPSHESLNSVSESPTVSDDTRTEDCIGISGSHRID
ncbi:UNVERIFIED_CONTAM: putative leucine-rich repeat receptor-like protein kinase [Sesamum radiatum]|uniref:Leucine-rich repeat receptor-like protein kinase n=1 Tax=Sesamum radiatum TaxID=300843 RepID=A0AAW2V4Z1_SESRA